MKEWHLTGSYYEACNCEAICPCRRHGDRPGGRSTYGVCDFVLSWCVESGQADGIDLADRRVVMVGSYDDDEPGSPWSVALYIDDHSSPDQRQALADIFLGRTGGTTFTNFARAIGRVTAVQFATITLDHTPDHQGIDVSPHVTVRTRQAVAHTEPVSCAIPGHHHPGREVITDIMRVDDGEFSWEVRGRCGFATDFAYSS